MLGLLLGLLVAVGPQDGERWFVSVEEVELADLLDACVEGLDLALDYDRALVQGRVSVRSEAGYTSEGIWSLANRQLAGRKLAIVQPSGEDALAVVPVADAARVARVEMDVPVSSFQRLVEKRKSADCVCSATRTTRARSALPYRPSRTSQTGVLTSTS